ncbi:MAG: cobalamin-dependent protein [Elusimicrobiales bacterium]|nr:cobalamin-dependent protein [Elusimicrobiales bacterium]
MIVLINPHMPSSSRINSEIAGISPPLGLLSIATFLSERSVDTKIIDNAAELFDISELVDRIKELNPSLVGITATTTNFNIAKAIISGIKSKTDIPVVIGGHHASALPEYTLTNTAADFVVIGEGELPLYNIYQRIINGGCFEDIKSIAFKKGDKIIISNQPYYFDKANTMMLDYSMLPINRYRPSLSRRLASGNFSAIITSRGCPYSCKFCSKLAQERYVLRDVNTIIKEVEFLKKNYDIRELIIWDDTFTYNYDRAIEIAKGIHSVSNVLWSCYSRVDRADDNLYSELYKYGLRQIVFGAESGNNELLKTVDKKITKEQTREAVLIAKKNKITTFCSVILGLPGETYETINETINFFTSIEPDYAGFCLLIPFPGSEFFDYAIENKLIDINTTNWDSYVTIFSSKRPPCSFCTLSTEELVRMQKYALRKFMFRGSYIAKNSIKMIKEGPFRMVSLARGLKTVLRHQAYKI